MDEATVGEFDISSPGEPARIRAPGRQEVQNPTGIDLDSVFILHKGNLAVIHEAQAVVVDAVQDIVRAQCDCMEQFLADARAALLGQQTVPGAMLTRSASTAKDVVELAVAAQKRVGDLLTRLARANLDEVRLLTK